MRFDTIIETVKRLIKKNGMTVKWRQVKDGAAATETPWKATEAADVDKNVSICFVPVKDKETRKLLQYLSGTEVPTGSLAGLMAPVSGFEPALKDVVIRAGKTLLVESIDKIAPNEQTVLYILEFKE